MPCAARCQIAQPVPPWAATETWSAPAPVPSPGDWVGSLNGYGDVGYFLVTAQSNRTLSVAVTALDETSAPTESKTEHVAASALNLHAVAGAGQVVIGPAFQPLTVRVTDSTTPPNPVLGASVLFQSTVMRPQGDGLTLAPGDPSGTQTGMPVILSASQSSVQSDVNGIASLVPSVASFTGTLEIQIQISAGTTAALQDELESVPAASSGNASPTSSQWHGSVPAPSGSRQQSRVDAW